MPAPTTSRLSKGGRSEGAYHRIRQLIVAGRLSPGARLVEADLAARFGVSRGAIRPALQRLRQEGLATAPRRGAGRQMRLIVAPLTHSDATELYLLLGGIEPTLPYGTVSAPRRPTDQRVLCYAATGSCFAVSREAA